MNYVCDFNTWHCSEKRVIIRADLNVPLHNGKIVNDLKLRATQPTIDAILKKNACVILMTHLGRPQKHEAEFSTQQLLPWFEKNKYIIKFAPDLNTAYNLSFESGTIVLLENLRFFPEEKNRSIEFAQQLAQLGDFFIQDAFGSLHNNDCSITLLPEQFAPNKKSIGLLVKKELDALAPLISHPKKPLCIILGGKKISDKIPVIEYLTSRADYILLCPAIAFTFLHAKGESTGNSLVDKELISTCKKILKSSNVILPQDYLVAEHDKDGTLSDADHIAQNQYGIAIGPKTITDYCSIIKQAHTVFYNGAMGFEGRPETLQAVKKIFTCMARAKVSIVAGGDSSTLVEQFNIKGISYVSTGGGATLTFLSGKPLPGLKPFLKNGTKTDHA